MFNHITSLYPDQIYDEDGDVVYEINEATSKLEEILNYVKSGEIRLEMLKTLYQSMENDWLIGGFGLSEGIPEILIEKITEEEKNIVANFVEERLSSNDIKLSDWAKKEVKTFLLQLREPAEMNEDYLNLIKESDIYIYISKIIELKKTEEVEKEISHLNNRDFNHHIAELEKNGFTKLIESEIISRSNQSINIHQLNWLFEYYQEKNRKKDAIPIGIDLMKENPSFDIYSIIKDMALEVGQWDVVEEIILSEFSNDNYTLLMVKIHLEEGRYSEAVKGTMELLNEDLGFWYHDLAKTVIDATSTKYPEESVDIYKKIIQEYIARKQRKYYQQACEYILDLKGLFTENNQDDRWVTYIKEIYNNYPRSRAL